MNEQEQLEFQKQVEQMEAIVKNYLTPEAISRYGNIKTAHPEKAVQILMVLSQAIQSNAIQKKVTDNDFKELLLKMQEPKKQFRIKRK